MKGINTDLGFQPMGLNQNKKTHTVQITFKIVELVEEMNKKEKTFLLH